LIKKISGEKMKNNLIYKIISAVAFIVLIFILALPQFYNVDRKSNTEACIGNMKIIHNAIKEYVLEQKKDFDGDQDDLIRTGYLKHSYSCPEAKPGDKYIISGKYLSDGQAEVTVICPVEKKFPDHKLPDSLK